MSVLIKGLKMLMPERCWDCRFMDLQTGKCYADGSVRGLTKGYKRPADCPLIELPDHGDLIDRDKLIKHGVYMPMDGGNLPLVYMSYVKGAEAVIPAERSE